MPFRARIFLLVFCTPLFALTNSAVADDEPDLSKVIAERLGITPTSSTVPADEIKEGWSKIYELAPGMPGAAGKLQDKVRVWVENGWLNVRAINEHGRTDWQVALAQLDGKTALEMTNSLGFNLKYGPYFVRDDAENLRMFRQFKEADAPAWPEMKYDGQKQSLGESNGIIRLSPKPASLQTKHFLVGDWHWVQSGVPGDHPDVWVRMEHKDLAKSYGGTAGHGNTESIGDKKISDEGDLLIASRDSVVEAELKIDINKARAALKINPVPELDAKDWHHTDNGVAVSMQALRGGVVLLDFWGGGYHTGTDEQGKLEALYQKYKDRGLMVVAVHSNDMGKQFEEILKGREFTYPVGLENGESAKRFGIDGYPTILLIDKHGMVKGTFNGNMPKETNIEKLLDAQ